LEKAQGAVRTLVTLLDQDLGNTLLIIVYTFSVGILQPPAAPIVADIQMLK